jgi:diguanylate cyclase (GGDEF)-like protein/putative nucleotidyltransferase with HDIG domain
MPSVSVVVTQVASGVHRYRLMDLRAGPDAASPVVAPSPVEATIGTSFMARVLAGLFAAGAALALLTVLLPHSENASEAGLLVVIAVATLVGAGLYSRSASIPARMLPPVLAVGSSLITCVAYFSALTPSPLLFFYIWVCIYSAYFFNVRQIVWQLSYVAVAYLVLLLLRPPDGGVPAWWLVGMGTLAVAAAVIRGMRDRVESLIDSLYDASRTDPLTRLTNRRGHRETLDLELERARRNEAPLALVMADLDHFKEVNDRCGHHVGDAALRRAAVVFAEGLRMLDAVARVGGEEFALVLPNTDAHEAFALAERLRCRLREEFAGDAVAITVSLGVSAFPQHGATAGALLRTADEALYAAKGSGRDRTVIYSDSLGELSEVVGSRDIAAERFLGVVMDLAEAVDVRFSGSARHSETVGRYAGMMALELGLSQERAERVRLAGMLHDVGKVGVPNSILGKPGPLTEAERALIARHPELGAQILEHASLADVRVWVGAHHERPDGQGYPLGLSADAIPIEASIVAVADAFEAMTSNRSYRLAMEHEDARAELERHAGSQFDASVVEALCALLDRASARAVETLASV